MNEEFYIFLDVDGVLNDDNTTSCTPTGFVGIDDHFVKLLRDVICKYNAKIILASDWKYEWSPNYEECGIDARYLVDKLQEHNLVIAGKTIDKQVTMRGQGILDWLNQHAVNNYDYIILDDETFDYAEYGELARHVILTDGLTKMHPLVKNCTDAVEETIRFLNYF